VVEVGVRVVRSEGGPTWLTVGMLVAALVLVLDLIFLATGQIELKVGLLIAGLAVARFL
jgi:threonine/homoserine efflux transporter RhtA